MSRRMSLAKPHVTPSPVRKMGISPKSRWSRLDYFVNKPTKLDELTDVARLLLKEKREEERQKFE